MSRPVFFALQPYNPMGPLFRAAERIVETGTETRRIPSVSGRNYGRTSREAIMSFKRSIGFALLLPATSAFCDVLSGMVTDLAAGTPLAGVKVSVSASTSTLSAANGSFSLNTVPSGLSSLKAVPRHREASFTGAYLWNDGPGSQSEVRDALGGWIMTRTDGVQAAPLAKASAMNTVTFAKTGYTTLIQQVDGSKSDLAVKMQKAAALNKANLTWFESYPDPGSEECIKYNGCTWAGQFAAVNGTQPESWVKANNIAAVHEKDFAKYRLKTLRLVQGAKTIDVKVYDMCSDKDCDGCCTENAGSLGFLIDVEKYTAERFGTRSGVVDWTCIDCTN
jgi:hypothetical protein